MLDRAMDHSRQRSKPRQRQRTALIAPAAWALVAALTAPAWPQERPASGSFASAIRAVLADIAKLWWR